MSQLQVTGEAKIRDIQGPVVANSGVVTALDGAASQYVRGDGTLADFPTSTGGGSSVSYYLNSSVSQGTISGVAYRELNREPVIGAGTDITISANGYVASYITDVNDPDLLSVPGGNFNCEFYFSVDSNAHNPSFYAELYKYDGATFTLLGTSAAVPEFITQGTTIAPYYFAIPVATAALALTDRLAIRIYVNVDGRTVTLHTENGHLCQVVTTFSKGMISLNNLTDQSQYLATGTSGTDFGIVSSGDTHTFNLPVASAANTGKLSSTDWSTFNGKVPYTGATQSVNLGGFGLIASALNITNTSTLDGNILLKKAGIAVTTPTYVSQFAASSGVGIGYSDGTGGANFVFPTAAIYNYTFPAITGTLALLEGTQTFSGSKTFSSSPIIDNGTSGIPLRFKQYASTNFGLAGYTDIIPIGANILAFAFGQTGADTKIAYFSAASLTNNVPQEYTLPNATGTIALLSGTQTFTGATTFSSDITVNGLRVGKGLASMFGNTALGVSSLNANTTGNANTAIGYFTLSQNTTGFSNVAIGYNSMVSSNGNANTAIGNQSMQLNTNGVNNTAIGHTALQNNTTGNNNIGIGYESGINITTGSNNTIIGAYAGTTTLANNIVLADGQGNIRYQWNGTNNVFGNPTLITSNLTVRPTAGYNAYFQQNSTALRINYLNDALTTNISAEFRAEDFVWQNNLGQQRIKLFTSGNVIIGQDNTDAGFKLDVSGTLRATGAATFSSSVTAATNFIAQSSTTNSLRFLYENTYNKGGVSIDYTTGEFRIYAGESGNGYFQTFYTQGTERMRITSAGNVGIGVTPASVAGITELAIGGASSNPNFSGIRDGANAFQLYSDSGGSLLYERRNLDLRFGTNNAERMRITSGGIVCVGKSDGTFGNVGHALFQNGQVSHVTDGSVPFFLNRLSSDGDIALFYRSSSPVGSISVTTSSTSYNTSSDYRLKQDLKDFNGLSLISAIKTYDYEWKSDNSRSYGVLAHELKEIIPYAVTGEKDGEDMQGVDYSKIVPVLVKAIQEQQAQIESQDAKIEELKALIAAK